MINTKNIYAHLFSITLTNIIVFLLLKHVESNFVIYLAIVLLYGISFLIFQKLLRNKPLLIINSRKSFIISLIITIGFCVYYYFTDYFPLNYWSIRPISRLAWHNKDAVIYVVICLAIMLLFFLLTKNKTLTIKVNDKMYFAFVFLVAAITFYFTKQAYTVSGYSFHHRHAYIYEIYKTFELTPYSLTTSGIYGHYGLFFYLPLCLLGGCNLENITIIISFISSITVFLFAYTINKLCNNKLLCCLAVLSIIYPYVFLTDCNLYYQSYPHRYFIIVLFAFLVINKKHIKNFNIIFWLSTVFSILWSNDIGLVYFICYFAYYCITYIFDKEYKTVIKYLFFSGLAFCSALFIIDVYNLINGGGLLFLDFFYPYNAGFVNDLKFLFYQPDLSDNSLIKITEFIFNENVPSIIGYIVNIANDINLSSIMLMPVFYLYFLIIIILITTTFYIIKNTKKKNLLINFSKEVLTIIIFTFGCLPYYFNRPAYGNLLITLPLLFVIFMFIREQNINNIINNIIVNYLAIMCFATLISLPNCFVNISAKLNIDEYVRSKEELTRIVPDGTLMFGTGSFEVGSIQNNYQYSIYDDIHYNNLYQMKTGLYEEMLANDSFVIFSYFDGGKLWSNNLDEMVDSSYDLVYSYIDEHFIWNYYKKPISN